MRSAEEWHDDWAADNEVDPRHADFIRAIQRDAVEAAAKVCEVHADVCWEDLETDLHREAETADYLNERIRAMLPDADAAGKGKA